MLTGSMLARPLYIQPSCRGPWKRRAEVGVMKGGERGHSAPRRCPLTLRWSLSRCWGYIQHFNGLPVVETSQKGSRDQQNLLGFCGSLTLLFLARRPVLRKDEERGYGCFLKSHSISCFVKKREFTKKKKIQSAFSHRCVVPNLHSCFPYNLQEIKSTIKVVQSSHAVYSKSFKALQ